MSQPSDKVVVEPRCKTCEDTGLVGLDKPLDHYYFCGCRYHSHCPDCTPFYARWLIRFMLWRRPIQ